MNKVDKSTVILGIITLTLSKLGRYNKDLGGYKSGPELRCSLFSRGSKIKQNQAQLTKGNWCDLFLFTALHYIIPERLILVYCETDNN